VEFLNAQSPQYSEFVKRFGVGLTGNIATGKSTVANIIRSQGYTVIDADQLSRKAVEKKSPALARIVEKFGASVLLPDGSLDRKKLGTLIFGDVEKKKILEQIMHPAIAEQLQQQIKDLGLIGQHKAWFYEASLLFETNSQHKFRAIWCTYCSEREQLRRLVARDQLAKDFAQSIMASQMPSKQKMQLADVVFHTEVPMQELVQKVKIALEELNLEVKSQFTRL
jgi:dephospho-CoA kinase